MSRLPASIAALALPFMAAGSLVCAAEPQMPKPGPEQQRLAFFLGEWTSDGEIKPSEVMGAGGKITSHMKCEWFDTGYVLACRSTGRMPIGATKQQSFTAYNAQKKIYTYYTVDAVSGMGVMAGDVPTGTVNGDTWTYNTEEEVGGKSVKSRVVIKELSPTQYTFGMDMKIGEGQWIHILDSTYTKEGAKTGSPTSSP